MPTLYVENVPEKLYKALRAQARGHNKSIAAEVLSMLQQYVVTPEELKSRQAFFRDTQKLRDAKPLVSGDGFDSLAALREDRSR
jgi:plasmid stability protein